MQGLHKFIEFSFINSTNGNKILCPCKICVNSKWRVATEVRDDLMCTGFMEGYHTWLFHGESSHSCPNVEGVEAETSSADNELADFLRDIACGLDDGGVVRE